MALHVLVTADLMVVKYIVITVTIIIIINTNFLSCLSYVVLLVYSVRWGHLCDSDIYTHLLKKKSYTHWT